MHRAFDVFTEWEHHLCKRLIAGLTPFKGLKIRGITSANAVHRRVPTVSFTLDGMRPEALAKAFASKNIFVWSGHNYAVEPVTRMGLMEQWRRAARGPCPLQHRGRDRHLGHDAFSNHVLIAPDTKAHSGSK